MTNFTIRCNALAKILFHAAKYPHLAVSGIVLAAPRNPGHSPPELDLVDAIPLFHGQLGLAPMLEVALTQIERYGKSNSIMIAGYYQANEHLRDNVPDFVAMKIAEKIAENNSDACLIMVENKKLSINLDSVPIIVSHLTSDGKWKNTEKSRVHIESESLAVISHLLENRSRYKIVDFDNHLDDISCDWTNVDFSEQIQDLQEQVAMKCSI